MDHLDRNITNETTELRQQEETQQDSRAVELQQQTALQLKEYPVALDPTQVAEILGVTRRYVDQLIKNGVLESFVLDETKQYKLKRVLKASLITFMIDKVTNNNNNS